MRKTIYSVCTIIFLFVLSTGFYNSYQVNLLKAKVRQMEAKREEDTVAADTKTAREGYYLKEEKGCVSVYRGDGTTLYENTSILVSGLPGKLQEEIRKGKYLESEVELYSFLENYSS